MSAPFDARPLVEPVDRAAVRAHTQALRRSGALGASYPVVVVVLAIVFGVFLIGMLGSTALGFLATVVGLMSSGGSHLVGAIALVPALLIGGVTVFALVTLARAGFGAGEKRYRLDRFARANGMTFLPHLTDPRLPGMIFGRGGARQAGPLVRGDRPRFVEFANYRYTTGSGKNRTVHRWGYIAVHLDVPLPHIVLDATSNNALFGTNLPAAFDRAQRLSLEGDFDRYFTLYCPRGYERDALYLFTPDIMARFVDHAAALDVEIVDDWLFLYSKRDLVTLDPAAWEWEFSVVGALLDKLAQWARWRDDRLHPTADAAAPASPAAATPPDPATPAAASALPFVAPPQSLRPPPGVAAPGRRLRRGMPWTIAVVVGVLVLLWLLSQVGVFAGMLAGFGG